MLISALSNATDGSGRTGLAEYGNDGKFIRTIWMPKEPVRLRRPRERQPEPDAHLVFAGKKNYMRSFGELTKIRSHEGVRGLGDRVGLPRAQAAADPPRARGAARAPLGAPAQPLLRIHRDGLTHQLVLIYLKEDGTWATKNIAISARIFRSISAWPDDSKVYVNSFMDGTLRVYDVSNPFEGKLIEQVKLGEMANMVSESWDGKRIYATNSLLSQWDKPGLLAQGVRLGGRQAGPKFTTDFTAVVARTS